MAKTFMQMVAEARAEVPMISVADAQQQMQNDPNTLMVDVRDAADIAGTGIIPGAIHVSLGTMTFKADQEVPEEYRDPRLQERDQPVIVTCAIGAIASLGGKLLKDMGFTNVSILDGGTMGWKKAGLPTEPFPAA